ncbi:NADPH-dependent ferric siderophore reductase [Williamsia limnetica]|uniref:NADPH-dependent ferric siderophore reductase n=1 Tax=Williamsia limnetica TaxID=882452 RepID=A0A318RJN3_WILLI|nr:siderophore-interacting protein [Williamsia limnetica]PYE18060.1 NADPH-dependent ferric siderophore reductase [Williamsia limnetica]
MKITRDDPRSRVAAHHQSGDGTARIGYPIGVRAVAVVRRELVSPRMIRLTLAGPELKGFHTYQADDHVMIVFPDDDGAVRAPVPNEKQELDWPRPLPLGRKYTIRRYDPELLELVLDFVLHEGGVASTWAVDAQPGDTVVIAGPPGAHAFAHNFDHYVFAVDATALPAVARWLDESPSEVSADVIVEVSHEDETQYPLAERDRVRVQWLVRPADRSMLADAVDALDLPPGRVFLFGAGEADDIRPLRRRGTDRLVTGYWKRGSADHDGD